MLTAIQLMLYLITVLVAEANSFNKLKEKYDKDFSE